MKPSLVEDSVYNPHLLCPQVPSTAVLSPATSCKGSTSGRSFVLTTTVDGLPMQLAVSESEDLAACDQVYTVLLTSPKSSAEPFWQGHPNRKLVLAQVIGLNNHREFMARS